MAEPSVPLGAIATTHGLDGWLKLNPFNADTAVLVAGRRVCLDLGDAHANLELAADAKPFKKQFLIKLRGIDRIEQAQCWLGATLSVHESELEPLDPGQYYHYQVIGFEVFHKDGARIGIVVSVLSTAGNDILVVKEAEKEFLIPAVKEIVDKVDFDTRRVIVDPPGGLLDL
jgi:16S rRNA processing protein RimM